MEQAGVDPAEAPERPVHRVEVHEGPVAQREQGRRAAPRGPEGHRQRGAVRDEHHARAPRLDPRRQRLLRRVGPQVGAGEGRRAVAEAAQTRRDGVPEVRPEGGPGEQEELGHDRL
jgi:hypothetical protein